MPDLKDFKTDAFDDIRAEIVAGGQLFAAAELRRMQRRRTARRGVIGTGLVAVAVVGTLFGAQNLTGAGRLEALPAGPAPRPGVTTQPALPEPHRGSITAAPATFAGSVVCQRIPLDSWETYVIVRQKTGGFALGRTVDGGRTWTGGVLPAELQDFTYTDSQPPCTGIDRNSLATHPTVVDGQTVFLGTMVTRDGGATWSEAAHGALNPLPGGNPAGGPVKPAVGPAMPDVPAGWRVREGLGVSGVYAVDPATNVYHPFTGAKLTAPPVVARDGSMWGLVDSGKYKNKPRDGVTVMPDVYYDQVGISRDRGRTWERHSFPAAAGAVGKLVALDQQIAYALTATAVLVTRDGGRSWSLTPVPAGYAFENPTVRSDGSLMVNVMSPEGKFETYLAVTTDGRAFGRITGSDGLSLCADSCGAEPASGRTSTVTGAYLAYRLDPKGGELLPKLVSSDGLRWTAVPIPPGSVLGAQS